MPVNHSTSFDRLLDYIPDLFEKLNNTMNTCMQNKKDATDKIINQMQKKCEKEIKKDEKIENED